MKDDLFIKNGIVIFGHEIEITASRSGGPGGQHANKADTRNYNYGIFTRKKAIRQRSAVE